MPQQGRRLRRVLRLLVDLELSINKPMESSFTSEGSATQLPALTPLAYAAQTGNYAQLLMLLAAGSFSALAVAGQ